MLHVESGAHVVRLNGTLFDEDLADVQRVAALLLAQRVLDLALGRDVLLHEDLADALGLGQALGRLGLGRGRLGHGRGRFGSRPR